MSDQDTVASGVPQPPFIMADYHKKALITLLHSFHNNRTSLTYSQLSLRLEVGEKTKAWQCVAWKDLRSNGYIVNSLKDKKKWELSEDKGVPLASTLVSAEELADYQVPDTTEKLHEQIKKRLMKLPKGGKAGVKILELMVSPDYIPLNRNDMASKFGTLADSHSFFYGLKALKDWGYVVFCDATEVADLKRRFPAETGTMDTNEKDESDPVMKESDKADDETKNPVKKESDKAEGETKKRKMKEEDEGLESEDTETKPPKKKQYKSKKKRTGGVPLKLAETVFVKLA